MKLYVKPWCPWCVAAKEVLDGRGYKYREFHVDRDPAAYEEMIRVSGQELTPTLVVGDLVLADFGPDELEVFLKQNSIEA